MAKDNYELLREMCEKRRKERRLVTQIKDLDKSATDQWAVGSKGFCLGCPNDPGDKGQQDKCFPIYYFAV